MVTRELEAFIVTAKAKSFQKASKQLFISSTSLINQINALEEETGLKLFRRTNRGIDLTEEGKVFYDTVHNMLVNYHAGIQKAKNIQSAKAKPIRFGFSPLNPYKDFRGKFLYDETHFSSFTFFMEHISGEYKDFIEEMRNLGSNVDVIPYFCGQLCMDTSCDCFCLARIPLCVAVPIGHPLAGKDTLTYEDLNDQILLTISNDGNQYYKVFNEEILKQAPRVELHPTQYYDTMTLNYAANAGLLVLAGSYLQDVHPMLKLCRVEWDLLLPYGLYYSKNPGGNVLDLLDALQNCGITGKAEDAPVVDLFVEL